MAYYAGMEADLLHKRKRHLYIAEWRDERGLSQEQLGARIELEDAQGKWNRGVGKNTVSRWEIDQRRLNPYKIAAIAEALDLEQEDLYRSPSRPSLDAIVKNESDELLSTAIDIVRRLTQRVDHSGS